MRLFLIISITFIILSLNAQKEDFGLLDKNVVYELSNKDIKVQLKIYQLKNNLIIESNYCECMDKKFYKVKNLKKLNEKLYYFNIQDYNYVINLGYRSPVLTLLNYEEFDMKNNILQEYGNL